MKLLCTPSEGTASMSFNTNFYSVYCWSNLLNIDHVYYNLMTISYQGNQNNKFRLLHFSNLPNQNICLGAYSYNNLRKINTMK